MLAEFFLSPETLCESDEGIRQLQTCLFPFASQQVGLICHFGEDEWKHIISHRIVRIPNPNQRAMAMALFQRICDELAVYRPPIAELPNNEDGWIQCAKESMNDLELDGIVISQGMAECPADCTRLSEFANSNYWKSYGNPRQVGRDTASQASVLRSVCAHSDWLIIRMPQVKGGSDDEIVTIKQIIQLANCLPEGFKKSDIFVEIPLPENLDRKYGTEEAAKRLMRGVKSELNSEKVADVEISVSIYPTKSILNREVIAGEFVKDSEGKENFKARWYLTMNHVAVGGRNAATRNDANSWNLYSRSKAAERLDKLAGLPTVILPETV